MNDLKSSLIKEAVVYGGSRIMIIVIPLIIFPIVTRYLTRMIWVNMQPS